METPKFTPVAPPPTPHPAETAAALQQEGIDRQRAASEEMQVALGKLKDDHEATRAELAAAKQILKDLVAAGVLTDGFVTNAVAQSLLNQAAVAKKFLAEHP